MWIKRFAQYWGFLSKVDDIVITGLNMQTELDMHFVQPIETQNGCIDLCCGRRGNQDPNNRFKKCPYGDETPSMEQAVVKKETMP